MALDKTQKLQLDERMEELLITCMCAAEFGYVAARRGKSLGQALDELKHVMFPETFPKESERGN